MIKKPELCLLVFDESWGEISQETEIVEIAVAGRHIKVHCIFVKHNLFHQRKWSRTLDLTTIQIVLLNSACNVQQIDHLGTILEQNRIHKRLLRKGLIATFCSLSNRLLIPIQLFFIFVHRSSKKHLRQLTKKRSHTLQVMARKQEKERMSSQFTGL